MKPNVRVQSIIDRFPEVENIFSMYEKDKYYDIIPSVITNLNYFDLSFMSNDDLTNLSDQNNTILIDDNHWYYNREIRNIIIFNISSIQKITNNYDFDFDKIKLMDAIDLLILFKEILIFLRNNFN